MAKITTTTSKKSGLDISGYRLRHPENIETPAFLVYEEYVRHNIQEVLKTCGNADRIVAHFKTHKSTEILKLQMEAGMVSFKCATLKEAEIIAKQGASEIIIAYPLLHPAKIKRFMALKKRYPEIDIKVIASTSRHIEVLSEAAQSNKEQIGVYLDLDTGMRRTGVQPGQEAIQLYTEIASTPGLKAIGVHVFDGQTLYVEDLAERKASVARSLEYIHDLWNQASRQGLEIIDTVAGGSWSFHLYLKEKDIRVSPGTWIYWDSRNSKISELGFKVAALVLGQVIDCDPINDTVTTDIGSKSASPDQPIPLRFKLVGHDSAELSGHSEEHGVIKLNGTPLEVGDMVLASPGHACTTTVKYPYALVINGEGDVVGRYGHQARDR